MGFSGKWTREATRYLKSLVHIGGTSPNTT